jgi:hypothetical protein
VPSTTTRPASGSTRRLIILRVVVLPEPEPPTRARSSPASTRKETPSTASVPSYRRVRPSTSIKPAPVRAPATRERRARGPCVPGDALERMLRHEEARRELRAALDHGLDPRAQLAARPQDGHVLLHVLRRPAPRVGDVGELGEEEPELGEEAQHLPGHRLHVVLPADHDEARHLVADEDAVPRGDLVLDAVHALGHAVVERARRAPADGRRHEHDVGPVHEGLVDAIELVARVHLRDRAGPGAGPRALRVVALAGPERELVEAEEARLGPERLSGVRDSVREQLLRPRIARVRPVHDCGRDRGHAEGAGLPPDGSRERVRLVRFLVTRRERPAVDEDAPALHLDGVGRDPVLLEPRLALARPVVEPPLVPGADDVVPVERPSPEGRPRGCRRRRSR